MSTGHLSVLFSRVDYQGWGSKVLSFGVDHIKSQKFLEAAVEVELETQVCKPMHIIGGNFTSIITSF